MFLLADMLAEGRGGPGNGPEAIRLLDKAGTSGVLMAREHLASLYLRGTKFIPQDYRKAIDASQLAINSGSIDSYHTLAIAYGNLGDVDNAAVWAKRGSDNGDYICSSLYADLLDSGSGVPRNRASAKEYRALSNRQKASQSSK
jgi:TPR repeat protein